MSTEREEDSKRWTAKCKAALEQALIGRFGTLGPVPV